MRGVGFGLPERFCFGGSDYFWRLDLNASNARPHNKRNVMPSRPKARVGLAMSSSMDFGQLGSPEGMLSQLGVVLAPMDCGAEAGGFSAPGSTVTILPTTSIEDIKSNSLAGLVVAGDASADGEPTKGFHAVIESAREAELPVMAFGEGVGRTLKALGVETDKALPPGVLLHHGVRLLQTNDDVRDAAQVFHETRTAA